jgi:hypothetical protein
MHTDPLTFSGAIFFTFFFINNIIYGIKRLKGEFAYSLAEYIVAGLIFLKRGHRGVKEFKKKQLARKSWNRYMGIVSLVTCPFILYYAMYFWALTFR